MTLVDEQIGVEDSLQNKLNAMIPCQCLEGPVGSNLEHALHFVYRVSLFRRVFPQRKYVSFEPGHPRDDVLPACERPAEFRATFKGKHPDLGQLFPSSYTLCRECLKHWLNHQALSNYEEL